MAVLTPKRNFISGDTPTPDHFNYASGLLESSPTMSGTAAAGDCVSNVAGTWTEAQAGVAIYDGTNVIGSGQIAVLTGLTAYSRYYAQSDGAISTTASNYPVGVALSTTQLYVSIPYITPAIIGADKERLTFTNQTVSTSNWATYTASGTEETAVQTAGYTYRKSLALSGVLSTMYVVGDLSIDADSCGTTIWKNVLAYDGGIKIYAKATPTSAFTILTVNAWKAVG